MKRLIAVFSVMPLLAAALPAAAKGKDDLNLDTPKVVQDLFDCRQIADATERLACYDQKVAAMRQAKEARDIVVADKAEVREARKGLFGLSLPSLKLFGGGNDADEVKEIDAVVKSAQQGRYGAWQFTLEDGATWQQIDSETVVFGPHSGSKVRIKRGAFGSFKANIDGQPGIKVRRIQ